MQDTHPDVIHVNLGGKSFALKYTLGSFRKAKARGVSVSLAALRDFDVTMVSDLIFTGLLHDYPKITPEAVDRKLEAAEDFDAERFLDEVLPRVLSLLGIETDPKEGADVWESGGDDPLA